MWFRSDLRLHDNEALNEALEEVRQAQQQEQQQRQQQRQLRQGGIWRSHIPQDGTVSENEKRMEGIAVELRRKGMKEGGKGASQEASFGVPALLPIYIFDPREWGEQVIVCDGVAKGKEALHRVRTEADLLREAKSMNPFLLCLQADQSDHARRARDQEHEQQARRRFLLESVEGLRGGLRALGSELVVRIGRPEEVLAELALQVSR